MSCKTIQFIFMSYNLLPSPCRRNKKGSGINRSIPPTKQRPFMLSTGFFPLRRRSRQGWSVGKHSGLPAEQELDRFNEVRELEEIDFRASRIEFCLFR